MSSATLTSLAMLKVKIDQGQDYLDYLRPFILQVLVDKKPNPVTDAIIRDQISTEFGLDIPERTVQICLKRLARQNFLRKASGVYQITDKLPDPGIKTQKVEAERHIKSVVTGLMKFSEKTAKPIITEGDAVKAICTFLSQFDIHCLRAYLRGTTIPIIEDPHDVQIILVSKYFLALQNSDPERFESFLVVVKGHMLANALLCPDLQDAPKSYKGVTFYLDTPLLVRRLGLEGKPKKASVEGLIKLLHSLGATVATFSHSRNELEHVIIGAAENVASSNGRGSIVIEARKIGATKSDLLLMVGQIDDMLREAKIDVLNTPRYIADFQIDEAAFKAALDDEILYFNPRAKDYDINSLRSIYVLRANTSPMSIERSKAALVTNNTGFSRAASEYGKRHEESREVSSVITDFSLANMAWLKAPLGAPDLPMTEVLAFSYAALQPSKGLLDKFLGEIEKLEKQGRITPRDHQLLRSSHLAQDEMMNLTLGEEDALTEETVTETLRRVADEIKREENEKLQSEQAAHLHTKEELAEARAEKKRIQEHMYWQCRHRAKGCAWCASTSIAILLLVGIAVSLGMRSNNPILGWLFTLAFGTLTILTLGNLIVGTTVRGFHQAIEDRCLTWFIRRESTATGFHLGNAE